LLAKVAKAAKLDQYRARKEARLAQDVASKDAWRLQNHVMVMARRQIKHDFPADREDCRP
jgi:hypothetical protein